MAAPKFLRNIGGTLSEIIAAVAGGAGNEEKIPSLDTNGRLPASMMPTGLAAETVQAVAVGAIGGMTPVNLYLAGGVLSVRLADATVAGKEANGFAPAAINDTETGTVQMGEGSITGLTGLTIGAMYFLGTTAGTFTATAPSASGNIVQKLGKATTATSIYFQPSVDPITVA